MLSPRFLTITGMILAAALSRLMPHPWNFSPVGAMALFAGAHFEKKSQAYWVPFGALVVSDLFLGIYPEIIFVYSCFAVNVLLGRLLKHQRTTSLVAAVACAGALQFFIVTNFGVWLMQTLYAKNFSGLMQCYMAGLPFFRFTLLGDLFYSALLFGSFAFVERRVAALAA